MCPCYAEGLHAKLDPEAVVHPEQPLAGLGAAALHRAAVAVVVAAARPGVGRARGVAVVQALGRYYLLTLCYHVLLISNLTCILSLSMSESSVLPALVTLVSTGVITFWDESIANLAISGVTWCAQLLSTTHEVRP